MSLSHSFSGCVDFVSPMYRTFSSCCEVQLGFMVYDSDDPCYNGHGFICSCPVDCILGGSVDVGDCCIVYYHYDFARKLYVVDELVPIM